MATAVQIVVGALREGLATQFTPVRPLACVETPVLQEVGAGGEGLAAVSADIGSLPSMRSLVLGKG